MRRGAEAYARECIMPGVEYAKGTATGKRWVRNRASKFLGEGFAKWAGWRGVVRGAASGLSRELSRCEVELLDVVVEGGATMVGLEVDAGLVPGRGSLVQYWRMPICRRCEHGGRAHNWISPTCSRCGNRSSHCPFCIRNYQRGRKRGQCQHPGCSCSTYSPMTDKPRPVNKFAGKLLYRKHR
jgi:hypothetical protein